MLLLLLACTGEGPKPDDATVDVDQDGWAAGDDCNDHSQSIHPEATETCNGYDDNCDGETDEGLLQSFWADADGDGYGTGDPVEACTVGADQAAVDGDCDDADPYVSPGATEICNGIDDNCDGATDDAAGTWYDDADGDGYGDPETGEETCFPVAGQVMDGTDCDDADAAVNPGAEEQCDYDDDNCDGRADQGVVQEWHSDTDGDGYGHMTDYELTCDPPPGYVLDDTDCRPGDAEAYPGAAERCNDDDDNCDMVVDEGMDADGDGHRTTECADGDDCDDTRDWVYPDALEDACEDGIDGDCDGEDPHCGYDGTIDLVDADGKYAAPSSYDAGRQMTVGDMTGDGIEDLGVATMYANSYDGGGYVLSLPPDGEEPLEDWSARMAGTNFTYGAGRSIGNGDVDGDGVGDIGFGAPYDSYGMWIVPGPLDQDKDLEDDGFLLQGPVSSYSGHGCDIGDVNGDGIADGVVGAYNRVFGGQTVGGVYVEYGPLTEYVDLDTDGDVIIQGDIPSSLTGRWVRAGHDFDGDGVDDLLIAGPYASAGAPSNGIVYVINGPPSSSSLDLATDYDASIVGTQASEYLGYGLGGGDIDGDGVEDVLLGSYSDGTMVGAATVYYNPSGDLDSSDASITVTGTAYSEQVGTSIDARDIDASGRGELLIGAPGGSGYAYLFYDIADGTYDSSEANATFVGESPTDYAGTAVRFADLDGDGSSEVYIGATSEGSVGPSGGAIYRVDQRQ